MDTDRLVDAGFHAYHHGNFEEALQIARRLQQERVHEGFKLAALLCAAQENLESAIQTLEAGLRVFPESWELWTSLGNFHSDKSEYKRARACLERAEKCEGANLDVTRLNLAIVLGREKQFGEALGVLDRVEGLDQAARLLWCRLFFLNGLDRPIDALRAFWEGRTIVERADLRECAACWCERGTAYLKLRRAGRAKVCFRKAILTDGSYDRGFELLREVDGRSSPNAVSFNAVVKGTYASTVYYRNYGVVCESEGDILGLVRQFEPATTRSFLEVISVRVNGPTSELIGVSSISAQFSSQPPPGIIL